MQRTRQQAEKEEWEEATTPPCTELMNDVFIQLIRAEDYN